MREHEIRTPHHNLLFCIAMINDESQPVLEMKHGKRVEQFLITDFIAELNSFFKGSMPEFYIATR